MAGVPVIAFILGGIAGASLLDSYNKRSEEKLKISSFESELDIVASMPRGCLTEKEMNKLKSTYLSLPPLKDGISKKFDGVYGEFLKGRATHPHMGD